MPPMWPVRARNPSDRTWRRSLRRLDSPPRPTNRVMDWSRISWWSCPNLAGTDDREDHLALPHPGKARERGIGAGACGVELGGGQIKILAKKGGTGGEVRQKLFAMKSLSGPCVHGEDRIGSGLGRWSPSESPNHDRKGLYWRKFDVQSTLQEPKRKSWILVTNKITA
jgi:hypothetical protein